MFTLCMINQNWEDGPRDQIWRVVTDKSNVVKDALRQIRHLVSYSNGLPSNATDKQRKQKRKE